MSENSREILKTTRFNGLKQYIAYDGTNRMEYVYEAGTEAIDGAPCIRTQYVYDGASNRIIKMKETVSVWVSATMDI